MLSRSLARPSTRIEHVSCYISLWSLKLRTFYEINEHLKNVIKAFYCINIVAVCCFVSDLAIHFFTLEMRVNEQQTEREEIKENILFGWHLCKYQRRGEEDKPER